MKIAVRSAVVAALAVAGVAGESVVEERFSQAGATVEWAPFPGFSPDRLEAVPAPHAPDRDGWIGRLSNARLGGFASLAYTRQLQFRDVSVEAWILASATAADHGPLRGIAVRVDPHGPHGRRFYRLAVHFTGEPRITLAYVGQDENNFPVYLRTWTAAEIPGGPPRDGAWHRLGLTAIGDAFSA